MPYIMVRTVLSQVMDSSGQVIIDGSPDDHEFRAKMLLLGGMLNGSSNCSCIVSSTPFQVLGNLERMGYKVVAANSARKSSTEVWQVWTLHKD